MKILIVSYYFPPTNVIGAVRIGKLAKYLMANGHDVRVLAARDTVYPSGLPVEIPEECITYTDPYQINFLPYLYMGGAIQGPQAGERSFHPVVRFLGHAYRTLFNFPDGQIGWLFSAVQAGLRIIDDWQPDFMYASAAPYTSLIVANRLRHKTGVPYVGELRDLWVDSHYYDHPALRRVFENSFERHVLSQASALVTVSEPLAEILRQKYGLPVTVVLNGFDPDDFAHVVPDKSKNPTLRIVHTGTIYPGRRDPTPLFKALRDMGVERTNFQIEFYGRRLTSVVELAEKYGVSESVSVHESVSYREALALQSNADVLLLLLWDTPEERGVFTGKLFEYIGSQRPILSVGMEDGVAAELIRGRAVGVVANDPAVIAGQLRVWRARKTSGDNLQIKGGRFADLTREAQFRALTEFLARKVPSSTKPPISIQILINDLDIGGTERHIRQVMPNLDSRQFRINVQTLRGGGALESDLKRNGVPVFSPNSCLPEWAQRLSVFGTLIYRLLIRKPQVLHFFLPESYLIGGIAGVISRHPLMIMSRRSLNNYQRRYPMVARIEKWLHRKMVALVGNSTAVVRQLMEEVGDKKNTQLIYNGIDMEKYQESDKNNNARDALSLDKEVLVFLIVANLIPYKGHMDLLHGFASAQAKISQPWKLICVGRDDGTGASLKELSRDLGIEGNIMWEGQQSDVNTYMSASDVMLLVSHEEGFSNSILEGMASACPMIVTDVGGNTESVIHGETGIVVPPRDPAALAEAIVRLANDSELRSKMGRAGQNRIAKEFTLSHCTKAYEKLYTDLVRRDLRDSNKNLT